MKKALFAIFLLGLALALPAEFHKHESGGVQTWFPDDWTVNYEDGIMTAESPDGDVSCTLEVLANVETLAAARDVYTAFVANYFNEFAVEEGEPKEGLLNNLPSCIVQGKATRDGVAWDVDVALVANDKTILILIVGNDCTVSRKYETTFQKILGNFKKI